MPFRLLDVVKARSKLELAGRIREEWKRLAPTDEIPQAVAISNRLGDLEQDRDAWWLSDERPAARQAFERVTRVQFRELPLARAFITSPDFSKLRPLRPGGDEPLPLATPDWFAPPGSRGPRLWIVAPPGSGRSLAVQWHRLRGTARAEEVEALGDATDLLAVKAPILLVVNGPPSEGDAAILAQLDRHDQVVVIATYPPPPGRSGKSPEATPTGVAGDQGGQQRWLVERWQPVAGWRPALIGAIAARVEERDTLLDPAETIAWLDRVDARHDTFSTPGDVVALCSIVHRAGVRVLRRDAVAPFLDARFKEEAARGTEGATWLRAWGLEIVRALVAARLRDMELPLWGPLSPDRWRALAPADLAPTALTPHDIERILDRKRTPVREARRLLQRRSGPEAVTLLGDARVLRPHGEGLSLHPRWIGFVIAREAVRQEIVGGNPATWGRWSVDRDRRQLVDLELDQLPLADLHRLAQRVCDTFDHASLGGVGAVEATFAAIGRRLGPQTPGGGEIAALWVLQQSLLAPRHAGDDPVPVTRPGFEDDSDWIACCWRWSLYGPRAAVDDTLAWLFPGWTTPTWAGLGPLAHRSVGAPGWDRRGPSKPGAAFAEILRMADEVVGRVTDPHVPEKVPSVLLPSVLVTAHRRTPRWTLSRPHIASLVGGVWTGVHVAERVAQLSPDDQVEVARTLWTAAVAPGNGVGSALDAFRDPHLVDIVARHLRTEDFAAALVPADARALERLHTIPARLRLPLVRHAVRTSSSDLPDLAEVLETIAWRARRPEEHYGEQDLEWMELLADSSRRRSAGRAVIWSLAPGRALARATSTPIDSDDAADWYNAAPLSASGALLRHLEVLSADGTPLPPWAILWLRRRILDAGGDADLAFQLLRRARGS
jgi:hypothetical protein